MARLNKKGAVTPLSILFEIYILRFSNEFILSDQSLRS